jgi:hypothetical protein
LVVVPPAFLNRESRNADQFGPEPAKRPLLADVLHLLGSGTRQ